MTASFTSEVRAALIGPLGVSTGETVAAVLDSLAAAIGLSAQADRRPTLLRFADAIGRPAFGDELAAEIHTRGTVLNQFRYERAKEWPWGTHVARRQLIEELWQLGGDTPANSETQSLARAAVLLAAAEGFPFGAATLSRLASDPATLAARTGWTEERVESLRAQLDAERERTGRFLGILEGATATMSQLLQQATGIDDAAVAQLIERLNEIAAIAERRPDIQWRLANMVWRLTNLVRQRGRPDLAPGVAAAAGRWTAILAEPAAARWLNEALTADAPPLKATGIRRLDAETAQRQLRRIPTS